MMIAFIIMKSVLVPLIKGVCAQNCFKFEIIGGFAFTSSAYIFRKKKYFKGKSS